jgi:hypothetical protein
MKMKMMMVSLLTVACLVSLAPTERMTAFATWPCELTVIDAPSVFEVSLQVSSINHVLPHFSETLPTSSAAGWFYGVALVHFPLDGTCHPMGLVYASTGARPLVGVTTGVCGVCTYLRPPGSTEVRS